MKQFNMNYKVHKEELEHVEFFKQKMAQRIGEYFIYNLNAGFQLKQDEDKNINKFEMEVYHMDNQELEYILSLLNQMKNGSSNDINVYVDEIRDVLLDKKTIK